jgi:hypothetical protein
LTHSTIAKDVVVGANLGNAIPEIKAKSFEGNASTDAVGSSVLKLEQIEAVSLDETWRDSKGAFFNLVHVPLRITNSGSDSRTIVKVESKYVDKGGVEQEPPFTRLGKKRGFMDFGYQEPPYNVEIGHGSELYCIRLSIRIVASQLDKHRRIHPQLPRPLQITLYVTDDKGKVATLKVEVGQEELKLKTQSVLEEQGKKKVLWFLSADDAQSEERVWAAAVLEREYDENVLRLSHWSNSSLGLKEASLFRLGWEAAKNGHKEHKLEFKAQSEDGTYSAEFWILVDLEKKLPYGIRVHLKAGTSSVIGERLLPDFSTDFSAK